MRKLALVTGGAGFIGSHLVDDLLAHGYEVRVLDNLSPQVHADAEADDEGWPIYLDRRIHRVKGDVSDAELFESALSGVTHLVHLAASVGVGQSMVRVVDYTRNNVLSAAIMLEVLSKTRHNVERIVVASSMSVYGEGAYYNPITGERVAGRLRDHDQLAARSWEVQQDGVALAPIATSETKLLQPASIYAINKRDQEEMFLCVGRALSVPTIALRLFNTYGSRQALSNPYTGVAAIFISRLLNDQAPLLFEDGAQRRDFVHVKDVTATFMAALESERPLWGAYNVGSGRAVTVKDMATSLGRLLGKTLPPETLNRFRVGDTRHCYADVAKIDHDLGFRPSRELESGMEELISWVTAARAPTDRSARSLEELQAFRLLV